jgi:hypothetical protein
MRGKSAQNSPTDKIARHSIENRSNRKIGIPQKVDIERYRPFAHGDSWGIMETGVVMARKNLIKPDPTARKILAKSRQLRLGWEFPQ